MLPLFFSLFFLVSCYRQPQPQSVPTIKENPPSVSKIDEYRIEVFAENLTVPWSIAWTDKDRMLVNERTGKIRIIQNGKLQDAPLHEFKEVSIGSEEGLMGLAIDPNYSENKFIYVSYAYGKGSNMFIKVVRYKDNGSSLSDEMIIIDKLPGAKNHAGCRLRFGPDGKLYITTGDATDRDIAQELDNLGGKILRINSDGSIPADNPFPNSAVRS